MPQRAARETFSWLRSTAIIVSMGRRRRRARHPDEDERLELSPTSAPATAHEPPPVSGATTRLIHEAGPDPERIAQHLVPADQGAQRRALRQLQQARGNSCVQGVVQAMLARKVGRLAGTGLGSGHSRTTTVTVERSADDLGRGLDAQRSETEALDTAGSEAATEAIGPATFSSWPVAASSLAEAADAISAQDEAGRVGWSLDMKYTASRGPIDSVAITAAITLEMPDWTPPPAMLPRAKAEWERWYAALRAHEQGHIDLVHAHFDGLAKRMLGCSPGKGRAMFEAAKATLSQDSAAYDKSTDHGRNAGTVMDVSIERREIDERKPKEAANGAGGSGDGKVVGGESRGP
jgi:hypothetical protein